MILFSIRLGYFNWAKKKIPNITFFYYTKQNNYDGTSRKLAKKFPIAPPVKKIIKVHTFKMYPNKNLNAYLYSDACKVLSNTNYG